MYKNLKSGAVHENEMEMFKKWQKDDIYQKSIDSKDDKNMYVFYDGPAFANGFPGLHHMIAKFLKDAICKYQVMNGKKIYRKVGWDTHGLPIENHVEKKLGFNSKKDIEDFGIGNFNNECRNSVRENEEAFTRLTHEMGQFIDTDNPYLTYKNEYIETEWWILKKFFDEGLFYEGNKILPYCPRCGTGLASHEVAQGYQTDTTDTVIVPMKKKDEDVYFLVWTTTPWTLLANVGLCVNPSAEYVKVESKGYKFIIASALAQKVLGDDFKVLEKYIGKDLEYFEYEQLMPMINVEGKAFFVTCDDYVTMEDGTGIVHLAPAFGEDDSRVGKKYDLPYLNPVGEDGCYTDGPWKNTLVFDANLDVIKYLKENDKLFKKQKIEHEYPHCWRCGSPLIYYARPSYYIKVTAFKDKLIASNKSVNWYPSYVGEKRFANWLENAKDWAVSRTRYWGSPIPYWKCECGYSEMIGSREELIEKAIEKIDMSIELHKPEIDDVHIKCCKCGKIMNRIPDVLDCWFDSGSMPFAQYHYPFENEKFFEKQFPADFICEGIDQTRGWFYTLMVISTFVKGCSPFKNVLVNDLLLDAEGKKMSKSKGNIVEPFTTVDEYGSDAVRFYLPYASPVWTPLKFDKVGLKEVNSKFFSTLKNTYNFFVMYANADKLEYKDFNISSDKYELIDAWMVSRYNNLVKYVTDAYNEYDLTKVVRSLNEFLNEDLSNWYIRRNRKRFWDSELTDSKKCVYKVTYDILVGISKLLAPVSPFISDEIYTNLTNNESVHLSEFPKYDEKHINEKLEEEMENVRKIIFLGRASREEAKIKIRQPISKIIVDSKDEKSLKKFEDIILEELNVKEIYFEKDLSKYMNYEVKPNYKLAGPVFGGKIKAFADFIKDMDVKTIADKKVIIDDNEYFVTKEMFDVKIFAKEGFDCTYDADKFVVIDTNITKELKEEGILRDIIRNCQLLRKEAGFNVEDRIYLFIKSEDTELQKIFDNNKETIESELLATCNNNYDYKFVKNINDDYLYEVKMSKI